MSSIWLPGLLEESTAPFFSFNLISCWSAKRALEFSYPPAELHEVSYQQDRQCTNNVTMRRVTTAIVSVEKEWVLHYLCVCVWVCVRVCVALGMQNAMHMRHIVISGLPSSTKFFHLIL